MNKKIKIISVAALCLVLAACFGIVYTRSVAPSPPAEETPQPTPELTDYSSDAAHLSLSELMLHNYAVTLGENCLSPDWAELYNSADTPVSLCGWVLSDGQHEYVFSDETIEARSYLIIYFGSEELSSAVPFGLSDGDSLILADPNGSIVWQFDDLRCSANRSLVVNEDLTLSETAWVTPGYENTPAGYEQFQENAPAAPGPLIISEAVCANSLYEPFGGSGICDWIEIRNISDRDVDLSGYYLSDKSKNKLLSGFSEESLAPGATILVCCTDAVCPAGFGSVPFSLSVPEESIWLTAEDGTVIDELYLHDIPVNGSYGRLSGRNGIFYFSVPTPNEDNSDGFRRVSARPQASIPPMTYDGVDFLDIELCSETGAVIYYTTDCTVPEIGVSEIYTGPIRITENTVIRAIAVEDSACPSATATFSYILNQERTLPVLSLVIDNYAAFDSFYWNQYRTLETPAVLSLYENGEEQFCHACGVQLKGWTSRELPKKSLGVYFRGKYGDGEIDCDLFGNGITKYSSLSVRAGQDYTFAVVRNEMMQNLCAEATDSVFTQNGKYCSLYINGNYWGLYCLKENLNEDYFSSMTGADEDTVYTARGQVDQGTDLCSLLEYTWSNDMSAPENYEYFSSRFDIDSLIDWVILEGYSCNSDTLGNIRYFRSPDYKDGRYCLCFYDLDWALWYRDLCFDNIFACGGNSGYQMMATTRALIQNDSFRERFLTRFSELMSTTLSTEHVMAEFERLVSYVEPEVVNDRLRWDLTMDGFHSRVDEVKTFLTSENYEKYCIDRVCFFLSVSSEERAELFPGY